MVNERFKPEVMFFLTYEKIMGVVRRAHFLGKKVYAARLIFLAGMDRVIDRALGSYAYSIYTIHSTSPTRL